MILRLSSFHDLPEYLRNKINGTEGKLIRSEEKPLTPVQVALYKKMESTITPPFSSAEYCREAADARAAAASLLLPPITNRGVTDESQHDESSLPSWEAKEKINVVSLGKKGGYKLIAIPTPDRSKDARYSFIDWVSFTFKVDDYPLELSTGHMALSDHDYVQAFSAPLYDVFGYGVTHARENGMNFYKHSFDLGFNGWGIVCIGGQRGSILVTVKAQGLMSAKPGWEKRLYQLLKTIPGAKITRVDLASDDFYSEIGIESYVDMYHAGLFVNRGQAPNIEQAGNWLNPNGKGRTLYIGCRTSGKMLRIYEKGLQLANGYHEKFPNWLRVELELKSEGRVIPFDVLLRPGQYLAGSYPALANMHKIQEPIETQKKTVQSTFERAMETTKEQFGRYIWTAIQILGIDEAIKQLTDGKESIPKRLNFDTFEQFEEQSYMHKDTVFTRTLEEIPLW